MRNRLLTLMTAFVVLSCNPLDIEQDNRISFDNAWNSPQDVMAGTRGIYQRLRSNFVGSYTNVLYWGELRVGSYMWGPSLESRVLSSAAKETINSTLTGNSSPTAWSALYSAIDQANAVIKYADKVDMAVQDKNFVLGQAHFARAYCYFWAARLWGDVPMNLVPVETSTQPECYPERQPAADVYAQIGKDIEEATKYVADMGTDKYFGTADALYMLTAEYGLWMYSVQKGGEEYLDLAAEALATMGIASSRLQSNYTSVFSRTNKLNNEVVFALMNDQEQKLTGGFYTEFYHPSNLIAKDKRQKPVPISATQWLCYSEEFISVLQRSERINGDRRVACNLGYGAYAEDGDPNHIITWPNKYLGDMSKSTTVADCDLLYYRYALAVMMDAELKYYREDYAGALKSLNLIAKRAYNKNNFYTAADKESVCQALVDEYFLEFPAEGVIWWALLRLDRIWDYNQSLAQKKTHPNILLWPISNSAKNKNNKLSQTEGWS